MKVRTLLAVLAASLVVTASAQSGCCGGPFKPGQGRVVPLGNLRTNDGGGPYNLTLLPVQANEVIAAIAARKDYTDQDIINFLTNVECLEGLFDTWGTFGHGFNGDLELGGPIPIGARKANLTERTRPFLEEVALNEQGHALFTRHAGSKLPCPLIDFDEGFNSLMVIAYNLTKRGNEKATKTVARAFGKPFDPFLNDQNYVVSVLSLEEVGARGNKGLTGILSNPVLANGVAGLATSATGQAASERRLLWDLRHEKVEPFGETAQQVFARVSAARDMLDGPPVDDQGITQTDPRNIAVPDKLVNIIPTDLLGLTFSMTPQQVLRIVTTGAPRARGGFFPKGVNGRINDWAGYDKRDPFNGLGDFPCGAATAAPPQCAGTIPTDFKLPTNVTDELILTQGVQGPLDNGTYLTRGYLPAKSQKPYYSSSVKVHVAENGCKGGNNSNQSPSPSPSPSPSGGNNNQSPSPSPSPSGGNNNQSPSPNPSPSGGNNNQSPSPSPSPSGGNGNKSPSPSPSGGNNNGGNQACYNQCSKAQLACVAKCNQSGYKPSCYTKCNAAQTSCNSNCNSSGQGNNSPSPSPSPSGGNNNNQSPSPSPSGGNNNNKSPSPSPSGGNNNNQSPSPSGGNGN